MFAQHSIPPLPQRPAQLGILFKVSKDRCASRAFRLFDVPEEYVHGNTAKLRAGLGLLAHDGDSTIGASGNSTLVKSLKFRFFHSPPCYTLPMSEKHDRPALRNLLDKLVQYGQQKVEEGKQAKSPAEKPKQAPLPRQMADPEVVKKVLARAKRLLAPSPEKLLELPQASKRIH